MPGGQRGGTASRVRHTTIASLPFSALYPLSPQPEAPLLLSFLFLGSPAGLQAAGSACQYPNGVTPLLPVSDRTAGRIPNKGGTKAISLPSTASLIASMRGYTRAV